MTDVAGNNDTVPKLLDFDLEIEETEFQATIDRGVGVLVYMSPEQAAYEPSASEILKG